MIYYKDCDLETGIEKILMNFSKEVTQDYLTIQNYRHLIVDFVDFVDIENIKSDAIEDLAGKIDKLELDLEDKSDAISSVSADLDELQKIINGMRNTKTKEMIQDCIDRMNLTVS